MSAAASKSKRKPDLALIATNLLRARDAGKEAYGRADELLEELMQHVAVGESIALPGGQVVTVVDNFATKNKVWKPCGISRFDIKASRAKDLTSKL